MVEDSQVCPHPGVNITFDLDHGFRFIDRDSAGGSLHAETEVPGRGILWQAVNIMCHRVAVQHVHRLIGLCPKDPWHKDTALLIQHNWGSRHGKYTVSKTLFHIDHGVLQLAVVNEHITRGWVPTRMLCRTL